MGQQQSNALYRDSIAWQKAVELTGMVYKLTSTFPPEERFGLTNQIRRAAVSIPGNIAEEKGRVSQGEMVQFIGMDTGSTLEVQTQLEIAVMLGFEGKEAIDQAHMLASEILRHSQCLLCDHAFTNCHKGETALNSVLYCLLTTVYCLENYATL